MKKCIGVGSPFLQRFCFYFYFSFTWLACSFMWSGPSSPSPSWQSAGSWDKRAAQCDWPNSPARKFVVIVPIVLRELIRDRTIPVCPL